MMNILAIDIRLMAVSFQYGGQICDPDREIRDI
jgi:hypothetical protein